MEKKCLWQRTFFCIPYQLRSIREKNVSKKHTFCEVRRKSLIELMGQKELVCEFSSKKVEKNSSILLWFCLEHVPKWLNLVISIIFINDFVI